MKNISYEIDQSGKIEQTSLDTVIAFSNGKKYAILLNKTTKRSLQRIFRDLGKPEMFVYQTFALVLAVIFKEVKPASNKILSLEEIVNLLWPRKKTGYSSISGTEGNLTQDWLPGDQKPSQSLTKKSYHRKAKKSRQKKTEV